MYTFEINLFVLFALFLKYFSLSRNDCTGIHTHTHAHTHVFACIHTHTHGHRTVTRTVYENIKYIYIGSAHRHQIWFVFRFKPLCICHKTQWDRAQQNTHTSCHCVYFKCMCVLGNVECFHSPFRCNVTIRINVMEFLEFLDTHGVIL